MHDPSCSIQLLARSTASWHFVDEAALDLQSFQYEHQGSSPTPSLTSACLDGSPSCFTWCDPSQSELTVHLRTNHLFSHIKIISHEAAFSGVNIRFLRKYDISGWKEYMVII